MDLLKHIQRGIAAAEIVHPDREAEAPEAVHLFLHEVKVAADHAFRDLNGDHGAVDSGMIHPSADLLHHVTALKIHA